MHFTVIPLLSTSIASDHLGICFLQLLLADDRLQDLNFLIVYFTVTGIRSLKAQICLKSISVECDQSIFDLHWLVLRHMLQTAFLF